MAARGLFRRIDLVGVIDTVVVALIGLGRVEACLYQYELALHSYERFFVRRCAAHTWMRFLPSALVTSGCSFGVVNV